MPLLVIAHEPKPLLERQHAEQHVPSYDRFRVLAVSREQDLAQLRTRLL
jgi:hypothetical protein